VIMAELHTAREATKCIFTPNFFELTFLLN